jgi:hypothetical protein
VGEIGPQELSDDFGSFSIYRNIEHVRANSAEKQVYAVGTTGLKVGQGLIAA